MTTSPDRGEMKEFPWEMRSQFRPGPLFPRTNFLRFKISLSFLSFFYLINSQPMKRKARRD